MKVQIYEYDSSKKRRKCYRWRVMEDDGTIICKSQRDYYDQTECAQELFRVYDCLENAHTHPAYTPRKMNSDNRTL